MTYRLRNILIALALALLAALLTTFYVTSYKKHVQHQQATVGVVVAAKDIPVGTTGANILAKHLLTTRQITRQAVVPGAYSSPQQVARLVATQPVYAGEQVTEQRFSTVFVTGMRGKLTGVYRAVQLPGDPNQLLTGILRPGDHVDLLASIKYKVSDFSKNGDEASSSDVDRVASRIILRDLNVLRTSSAPNGKIALASSGSQSWVVLKVTDNQAQKLFFVMKNAEWSLELRPPIHDADSPNSVETIESVLGDGLKLDQYVQLITGKAPQR